MSRLFYHVMQDNAGNLLFDVTGTMRLAGTGTLATIYGDEALSVILPNPMTNHPSFGSFKCFLGVGDYDFYMAKSGYTFETLTGVQGSGSMADQNANDVLITGGYATFTGGMTSNNPISVQTAQDSTIAVSVSHAKSTQYGMMIKPTGTDTGQAEIAFLNVAGSGVGFISTTATTTTYSTTSDARLKRDVDDLTGALAVIQALRPVRFRWNADDSPGVGFLAQEVARVVQGVITGEADAVNPDGTIKPQMIDYSKLVPFLTGAMKTLAAQVQALTARVATLEDGLGV